MKYWRMKLTVATALFVGWTSMGCVLVVEGTDTTEIDAMALDAGAQDDASPSDDTMSSDAGMEGDATEETIEIAGDWSTSYGESYAITSESWGSSSVEDFDNDANWAVTQYSEDDEWNPNLFAKQVWTEIDEMGFFYQCTVLFSAETLEEATNAEDTADYDDLDGAGCAGFPWTKFGPSGSFDE
jgi:hypothetical protein